MSMFSSGTRPLMAERIVLSRRGTRSCFRWFLKKGDGVAKMSRSEQSTISLMSVEKWMRSVSNVTAERYEGLCFVCLNSSMTSCRRMYQFISGWFESTILANAVAQLPPPMMAIFPGKFSMSILFCLRVTGGYASSGWRVHASTASGEGSSSPRAYFLFKSKRARRSSCALAPASMSAVG